MENENLNSKPYLSIVVPLYNEEGNVEELHRRIKSACEALGKSYEIIFVDDGSDDKTVEKCVGLSPLKLIKFRRNFGQTAAFDAGIKQSRGEIIITMDGDLQNDPQDISKLLEKMKEGYDVVSGWRWQRKDSLSKKIFSRGADFLRKILLHDEIHDSGCSLKAYKKECFDEMDLFGEMHRFIPALVSISGYKVGEVKVSHHPRVHGKTKYNWKRVVKGFVDMISVWFWEKFSNRPLHLFGGTGILFFLIGALILVWMATEKLFLGHSLSERIWPMVGIFMVLMGIQFFISGLLADIMVRSYYKNRKNLNYSIKEIIENK